MHTFFEKPRRLGLCLLINTSPSCLHCPLEGGFVESLYKPAVAGLKTAECSALIANNNRGMACDEVPFTEGRLVTSTFGQQAANEPLVLRRYPATLQIIQVALLAHGI